MYKDREFKVGVYIRLSREDGDDRESESVENQRKIINQYIEAHADLERIDEYIDDGYTGTNFERPGFKRLIADIEVGVIDCVVTKDLSRFGRDHIDTGYYLERYLPQMGVRYIAIGDGVDTATSSGLNFMAFKLSFNDYYSLDISNKIKAVKKMKQEKGEYIANFAPYGYKKDPKNKNHLIINEENAPTVKRIFDLYLNGYGTPKITKLLNDENVPPPSNYMKTKRYESCKNKWSKGTVYRILKNEVYTGTIVGRKSYKINHKVKTRIVTPKDQRIYVLNRHQEIIDMKTFNAVQKKLKDGGKNRNRKNFNPLKKFVYCGCCGAKASMKTHKRQVKSGEIHEHQYFICGRKSEDYHNCSNGRIASRIITPIVQEQLEKECSKIVFSKGDITSIYEQAKETTNTKKALIKREISKREKEVQKIEKKIEQIYADKLEGLIKPEDFSKFYNVHQENKERILREINELKQDLVEASKEKVINYKIIKEIADECLKKENLDEVLLEKFIERIEYKGREIKIKYKFMECK